ncbi:hypothetical protein APHCR_0558 [Anaplasma phagocytophilum str. CR1007]|nr:hypothetical protein APHCR_0558 [Anaplasma phagocytophilum str. CR1007]
MCVHVCFFALTSVRVYKRMHVRGKIQMYALVECMTRLNGMYSLWLKVHKWYMCLGSVAFCPRYI